MTWAGALLEGRKGRGYKWSPIVVRDHLLLDARHVAVGIVRHQRLVGRHLLGHLVLRRGRWPVDLNRRYRFKSAAVQLYRGHTIQANLIGLHKQISKQSSKIMKSLGHSEKNVLLRHSLSIRYGPCS